MKKLAITIFFDAFALMLLGLIIVMSASSTYSVIRFDSVFHLFNSHLFKVGIAFFLMIFFSMIPYEEYKNYCKPAMIGITLVLIITLLFAPSIKGSVRSINLGIVSFQPAD
ncbi:MAG: FtsW/RodA/SpoVE family cell cycle protein, partial [Bacteroidetes bacterium]|nr:FtsW/RodA/SpoVE family cell cycle protein [Bacteroidota bacterium]